MMIAVKRKGNIINVKKLLSFKGGVHPPEGKKLSEDCAIEQIPQPKQVSILMSQHIGAVCSPTVAKRDKVEFGQVIGDSDAFVSAKIHSSVSGTVKDIALRSHPVLGREIAVVIDVDEEHSEKKPACSEFNGSFDLQKYTEEQIIDSISNSGIVGMGGAGFPTNIKVAPNPKMPKHTMIVNACECEPYITCDYRMMIEWTSQFIAGILLMQKASGCEKVFIGIENNKPEAIKAIEQTITKTKNADHIVITPLKTKYPQGGERQLIQAVLGTTVPTGQIPPTIGVLVTNVATACATAEAVVCKKPLTHRAITVTGGGVNKPGNYYVPVGTPVSELIELAGGMKDNAVKVIMGGPMMGFSIADLTTPTTKTSGSVLILTRKEVGAAKVASRHTACIRCGRCLDACPEGLNPTKLAHAVKANNIDLALQYHMTACIECGCCSYVCPANIELTGYVKAGKIQNARMNRKMP